MFFKYINLLTDVNTDDKKYSGESNTHDKRFGTNVFKMVFEDGSKGT